MSDEELPERLFATDRYPSNRLNVYSKPDYITFIHHTLRGTPDSDIIRKSTFGKLYDIPAVRVPNSKKLVHGLLSRQLLTKIAGHELENGMEMMDDKMVDAMRKEYAMDIYRKMVIPIYNDFKD